MKKLTLLGLLVLPLMVTGCAETRTINVYVKADYGVANKGKVTLLVGSLANTFDYDFVVGDFVTIKFEGDWSCYSTYPTMVVEEHTHIKGFTVKRPTVYEYKVMQKPGGGADLLSIEEQYRDYKVDAQYIINKDATYLSWESLRCDMKLYGIKPYKYETNTITALYSYNPLED